MEFNLRNHKNDLIMGFTIYRNYNSKDKRWAELSNKFGDESVRIEKYKRRRDKERKKWLKCNVIDSLNDTEKLPVSFFNKWYQASARMQKLDNRIDKAFKRLGLIDRECRSLTVIIDKEKK